MSVELVTEPHSFSLMGFIASDEHSAEFKQHLFVSTKELFDLVNSHMISISGVQEGPSNEIVGRTILFYLLELGEIFVFEIEVFQQGGSSFMILVSGKTLHDFGLKLGLRLLVNKHPSCGQIVEVRVKQAND